MVRKKYFILLAAVMWKEINFSKPCILKDFCRFKKYLKTLNSTHLIHFFIGMIKNLKSTQSLSSVILIMKIKVYMHTHF